MWLVLCSTRSKVWLASVARTITRLCAHFSSTHTLHTAPRTERVPQPTPFASLHRSRALTRTTRRAERTRAAPRHAGTRAPASRDEPRRNSELVHEEARSRRAEEGRPAILSGACPTRVELWKQAEAAHRHVASQSLVAAGGTYDRPSICSGQPTAQSIQQDAALSGTTNSRPVPSRGLTGRSSWYFRTQRRTFQYHLK